MSGVVIKQRTDTEKISQFLGRIRTGSSYLKAFETVWHVISKSLRDAPN